MDEALPVSFGTLLRRTRRATGLTQAELAERTGVSVRSISDLERDVAHTPHRDTVQLLTEALALPGDERERFALAARRVRHQPPSTPAVPPASRLASGANGAVTAQALPTPLTPLVGRGSDMAAVRHLLERTDVRLVTLLGLAGVG